MGTGRSENRPKNSANRPKNKGDHNNHRRDDAHSEEEHHEQSQQPEGSRQTYARNESMHAATSLYARLRCDKPSPQKIQNRSSRSTKASQL